MGNVGRGMREPREHYSRLLWPHDVPHLQPVDYWKIIVDRTKNTDLRPAGRASFDSVLRAPHHPALAALSVLAHARSIDVVASRYIPDAPTRVIGQDLFTSDDIWLAATIDAATTFAAGDAAAAELKLREMISAGLLLVDGSPFENDLETGARLALAGRDGMAFLYDKTGRQDGARALRQTGIAFRRAANFDGMPYFAGRGRQYVWNVALSNGYSSIRWSAFQAAVPYARCKDLRALLFGPSREDWDLVVAAERSLVHSASDSVLLRAVLADTLQPRPLPRRPGIRRMVAVMRLVLTDRHFDSSCTGAFTTRF